ncbi:hypothetical protein PoB_002011200 [Plakobranchus ocellatus]|uniref:Uncharacterized protein n=1 Tax=Plakobranchus ocellatus TaxID=259542 RepID=A0AAV3ZGE7_9GAST|nr:hypothetical protein PoB_002011200 [Plakobranchus ocellatus]
MFVPALRKEKLTQSRRILNGFMMLAGGSHLVATDVASIFHDDVFVNSPLSSAFISHPSPPSQFIPHSLTVHPSFLQSTLLYKAELLLPPLIGCQMRGQ